MTNSYEIKVYYTESDSETPPKDCETVLPFVWERLSVAKEVLQVIKEHYDYFQKYNGYGEYRLEPVDHNKALEEAKTKPWFVEGTRYSAWEQRILLPQDDGTWKQTGTCWCGYFELLVGADIFESQSSDMSFRL